MAPKRKLPIGEAVGPDPDARHAAMFDQSPETDESGEGREQAPESEEVARLRDPNVQYEILNPEEMRLAAEVFLIEWWCDGRQSHVTVQDERPAICSHDGCRSAKFEQIDKLETLWFTLKLAFTELQIHRRKIFEHIEHFAMVLFAEVRRHHAAPELTKEWINEHRGYFEAGMVAPQTRRVLRELLAYINPAQAELVDSITEAGQMLATVAILKVRQERIARLSEKKTTTASGSGSGTSTPS